MRMKNEIEVYNDSQAGERRAICNALAQEISHVLPEAESKIWHASPVWFINGNPIVGYSNQKPGIRLMFWSGMGFGEDKLLPSASGKFKDASIFYNDPDEINTKDLQSWLEKSKVVQWDYKNIVKRRGALERIK